MIKIKKLEFSGHLMCRIDWWETMSQDLKSSLHEDSPETKWQWQEEGAWKGARVLREEGLKLEACLMRSKRNGSLWRNGSSTRGFSWECSSHSLYAHIEDTSWEVRSADARKRSFCLLLHDCYMVIYIFVWDFVFDHPVMSLMYIQDLGLSYFLIIYTFTFSFQHSTQKIA